MTDTAAPIVQLEQKEKTVKRRSESLWTKGLYRLRRDKLTMTAIIILAIISLLVMLAPVITSAMGINEFQSNTGIRLSPFGTAGHPLGTDHLGRDVLARLLYGGQISLSIGVISAVLIMVIGTLIGMTMGYKGGLFDDVVSWIITTLDSLPSLYLLIAVSAFLRPTPEALILVISMTSWTGAARLIRGQTVALRGLDYITASKALGAPDRRIIFQHIFPNLISIIVISVSLSVGGVILTESALSFLNLGVQPPTPTWGNILADSQSHFRQGPHLLLLPGIAIFITVMCTYVIGDGLRDAFDPTATE
jgi:ABC-type dipeptide/oligopeptide/nickel transport system permease subunit